MSLPQLTTQYVAESFGWNAVARARLICRQGDVLDWSFSIDGTRVMGGVRDSQRANPHKVALSLYDRNDAGELCISGQCSCVEGHGCLHATALALTLLQDLNDSGVDPGSVSVLPAARSLDFEPLPPDLPAGGSDSDAIVASPLLSTSSLAGSWFNRLVSTLPDLVAAKDLDEFVIYCISAELQFGEPELRVEPCAVRRLKTGTPGSPRSYSWRQLAGGQARFIQASDRSIADLWVGCSARDHQSGPKGSLPPPADPDVLNLLLTRIIATGRAYWAGSLDSPLSLGLEKDASIEWIAHTDSRQSPRIVPGDPEIKILNACSPWYVDVANHQAGPLKLPFAGQTVRALLAAPRLSPGEALVVRSELERLNVNLPLPLSEMVQEVRSGPPTPCLHLKFIKYKHPVVVSDGGRDLCLEGENTAVLSFDYGFDASKLSESWQNYQWLEGNKSIITERNIAAEKRFIDLLGSHGLSRSVHAILPANKAGYVARKQAQQTWYDFLQLTLPLAKQQGWQISTDPSFQYETLEADSDWICEIEASGDNWFSLELGIVLNDKRIPLLPILAEAIRALPEGPSLASLEQLNKNGKFYAAMPDGKLLAFPFERVRSILSCLIEIFDKKNLPARERLDISLPQVMALLEGSQSGNLKWQGNETLLELAGKIKSFDWQQEISVPQGFNASLRPYQSEGLRFLEFVSTCRLGGILADDMGLGKTVQALAHILREKQLGRLVQPVLVLCPTSVLPNWLAEAKRFAPQLRVLSLQGADRAQRFEEVGESDLVLSTYPLLVRDSEKLTSVNWHAVILDEAQAIKNHLSKSAQTVLQLASGYRLCLTGTPIENHLGELWSQFNFLMGGLLGSRKTFEKVFQTPIEEDGDRERLELLYQRIRPFILRRTKEKVAADLPPKTVIVKQIELEGQQSDLYETVRLSMHEHVLDELKRRGVASCQLIILDALLKLRQVCCDPRLVKLPAAAGVTESAKLAYLLEMVDELVEAGRRIIVFSQFTSMLDLIAAELQKKGIDFVELRGDTRDRLTPVTRFQSGSVPLFLVSLKAGGTGLNLTAADTVIHYDPWWNPAVEEQASDRAHRIGQDKPVFVYRLVAAGTIEELILDLQERKRALSGSILDRAGIADGATRFDESDLANLFAPLSQLRLAGQGPATEQDGLVPDRALSVDCLD